MELIFRNSEPHRPTVNVVIAKTAEGQRRAFIVPNLSGQYLTNKEALELAHEKADKAGFADAITESKTLDMESHARIED